MDNKTIDSLIKTLKKFSELSKLSKICINKTLITNKCDLYPCLSEPSNLFDGASCCSRMTIDDGKCSGDDLLSLWIQSPSPTTESIQSQCGFGKSTFWDFLCLGFDGFRLFGVVVSVLCIVVGLSCCVLLMKTRSVKTKLCCGGGFAPLLLLLFGCVVRYGIIVTGHIGFVYGCMEICNGVLNCYFPLVVSTGLELTESAILMVYPLLRLVSPTIPHWKHISWIINGSIVTTGWIVSVVLTTKTLNRSFVCSITTKWLLDLQIKSKIKYFTHFSIAVFIVYIIFHSIFSYSFKNIDKHRKIVFGGGSRFVADDVRRLRKAKQRLFLQKIDGSSNNCIVCKTLARVESNVPTLGPLVIVFVSSVNNWLQSWLIDGHFSTEITKFANLYVLFVSWNIVLYTLSVVLFTMYLLCKK